MERGIVEALFFDEHDTMQEYQEFQFATIP
jgi:hypothetical protein